MDSYRIIVGYSGLVNGFFGRFHLKQRPSVKLMMVEYTDTEYSFILIRKAVSTPHS